MSRRKKWTERPGGLFERYDNEPSTTETNCPACTYFLSGDCIGDYEGCRRFEPKGGFRGQVFEGAEKES